MYLSQTVFSILSNCCPTPIQSTVVYISTFLSIQVTEGNFPKGVFTLYSLELTSLFSKLSLKCYYLPGLVAASVNWKRLWKNISSKHCTSKYVSLFLFICCPFRLGRYLKDRSANGFWLIIPSYIPPPPNFNILNFKTPIWYFMLAHEVFLWLLNSRTIFHISGGLSMSCLEFSSRNLGEEVFQVIEKKERKWNYDRREESQGYRPKRSELHCT